MSNVCFPTSILIHFGPFPKSLAGSQPFKPSRARFPPKKNGAIQTPAELPIKRNRPPRLRHCFHLRDGRCPKAPYVGLAIHRNSQHISISCCLNPHGKSHNPNVHRPFNSRNLPSSPDLPGGRRQRKALSKDCPWPRGQLKIRWWSKPCCPPQNPAIAQSCTIRENSKKHKILLN